MFPCNLYSGYYQTLFDDVKIMQQEICCYDCDTYRSHIYEHSLCREKKYRKCECVIKINNEGERMYPLAGLVDFSVLFKALFNAPVKQKNDTQVIYDLSESIIPDNFKEARASEFYTYSFEKDVLSALQNAIIKRYEEQPKTITG